MIEDQATLSLIAPLIRRQIDTENNTIKWINKLRALTFFENRFHLIETDTALIAAFFKKKKNSNTSFLFTAFEEDLNSRLFFVAIRESRSQIIMLFPEWGLKSSGNDYEWIIEIWRLKDL